jgi:hypothetical protein
MNKDGEIDSIVQLLRYAYSGFTIFGGNFTFLVAVSLVWW